MSKDRTTKVHGALRGRSSIGKWPTWQVVSDMLIVPSSVNDFIVFNYTLLIKVIFSPKLFLRSTGWSYYLNTLLLIDIFNLVLSNDRSGSKIFHPGQANFFLARVGSAIFGLGLVKDRSASYLLRVKSMLGLGQGPSLVLSFDNNAYFSLRILTVNSNTKLITANSDHQNLWTDKIIDPWF